jgi:hypothetical protein
VTRLLAAEIYLPSLCAGKVIETENSIFAEAVSLEVR